jgi:hypothetical protein
MQKVAVSETANRLSACTLARDTDRPGARMSILFVANIDSHIWAFHMLYMRLLCDMGYEVEVAAAPAGFAEKIRAEGYEVHTIPFSRNPLSARNVAVYRDLRGIMQNRHYVMCTCIPR